AARDRELHREPGALRLQRVLDDLDEHLLPRLDQLVDAPALATAAPRGLLAPRENDLVDVQEPVAVEADVDERRLHAGEHVVDHSLVDVADDRPLAAALDVELGDLEVVGAIARRVGAASGRSAPAASLTPGPAAPALGAASAGALRFEHRDAGLAGVG